MSERTKLINVAKGEIGYHEKASGSNLDSKTANSGSANYTKYGRDLRKWLPESGDTYGLNYEWCDQFVDWCFITAFGTARAKTLLGGWSAYTPTSAAYFKKMNRYDKKNPKTGDVVFFYSTSKNRIGHTGLVEYVEGDTVHTIEGNSSNQVIRHSYNYKTSTYVNGFGHPAFDESDTEKETKEIPNKVSKTIVATGTVTASTLNVRVWAGTEYKKLTSYPSIAKGTKVSIGGYIKDEKGAKWYYVQIDGTKGKKWGFVHSAYVKVD